MNVATTKSPPSMRQRLLAIMVPMALVPLVMFGSWAVYRHGTAAVAAAVADDARFVRALAVIVEQEAPKEPAAGALEPGDFQRAAQFVKENASADQIVAILPEDPQASSVPLAHGNAANIWDQLAQIRSRGVGSQVIGDLPVHVTSVDVPRLNARIVSTRSQATMLAPARRLSTLYIVAGLVSLVSTFIGVLVFTRRLQRPILAAQKAAEAWGSGDLNARATTDQPAFHAETAALVGAFDAMAASLRGSQLRARVLYKSTTELFHCADLDAVVRKAVELACTQCGADLAWFDPARREEGDTDDRRQAGAWMWKQHRLHERSGHDLVGVWQRRDGDRVFSFSLKGQGREIGTLRAAYGTAPDELGSTLLHSLAGLLDMAIAKFDQGMRGAMLQTEVDMAEKVRRDLADATREPEKRGRVAFHYQPSQRFGGDWFHLVEVDEGNVLYAVIGDVTGHGLVQGMITTAVKGALDAVEALLKQGVDAVKAPSAIVGLLDAVVRRVASRHALAMTCVAVRIDFRTLEVRMCNAGHTFPILVREDRGMTVAMHLHKEQQSMLGVEGPEVQYREAVYHMQPRDLLVLYTDGLTSARSLKSEVFGKFLFRSLKRRRDLGSAAALRDDILAMFRYYTQNQRVDDDVCFLVTQMSSSERRSRDSRSTPAA